MFLICSADSLASSVLGFLLFDEIVGYQYHNKNAFKETLFRINKLIKHL